MIMDIKIERRRRIQLEYYYRCRDAVIAAYGGKCACCGEIEKVFLQLDHIKNDGGKERKKFNDKSNQSLFRYLAKKGWPKGYQILCANCHQAKTKGIVCPHKR